MKWLKQNVQCVENMLPMNHFRTVCFQGKPPTKLPQLIATVCESPLETSESEDEIFSIEHVGIVKNNHKGHFLVALYFDHELGNTTIDSHLDTSANCNMMCRTDVRDILRTTNPPLQPEALQLRCYDNSIIKGTL